MPDVLTGSREALEILERSGALQRGHFRLSSGLHSDVYLQCALTTVNVRWAETLGRLLGALHGDAKPEAVVGPALGGVLLAHETARALGARSLFAERAPEGGMALRRGFRLKEGERVLVVEDVLTTGGSALEAAEAVRAAGGRTVAVGALCDRRPPGATDRVTAGGETVPVAALVRLEAAAVPPDECPACARGDAILKPGSRPS